MGRLKRGTGGQKRNIGGQKGDKGDHIVIWKGRRRPKGDIKEAKRETFEAI